MLACFDPAKFMAKSFLESLSRFETRKKFTCMVWKGSKFLYHTRNYNEHPWTNSTHLGIH